MADQDGIIFDEIKKTLNLDKNDDSFDVDVKLHVNSVFSTLQQLGVGPKDGFMLEDGKETWVDFLGTGNVNGLNAVKSYLVLRTRLLFDPPATSFTQDSFQRQIDQLEWRLNVFAEGVEHPWPPTTP